MDSSVSNNAFQEALQRARQLAAKIAPGVKRPVEDSYSPDSKRLSVEPHESNFRPQKNQLYLNGAIFNGEKTLDIMVPGNKVGFVIGKGGDMIRNLQDRAGVKMVIFQESSEASDQEKQLRITGPPDKVEYAKQLVNDLLVEKELESAKLNNAPRIQNSVLNEYGSSRITYFEYPVSPQLIGLVIGKGGDTIRKIQADSGCKVQFDTAKTDAQGNKICQFTGTQDSVNKAVELVKEIIDAVTGGQGSMEEVRLIVPTSRTGTVIGRGGETIRSLKQQSGCNIELDKNFQSDNDEKCFILRGTPDKIGYAQQLVTDKVGGHATVISNTMQSNPLYNDNPYGYLTSQIYANQLGQGQSAAAAAASAQYYWPQTAATTGATSATDPNKSVQDQYAMWAAYYAQYYQQGATVAPTSTSTTTSSSANGSTAAAHPSQDTEAIYQQWIEYYNAYGMTKEAEEMKQKLKEFQMAKKSDEDSSHKNYSVNGNSDKKDNDY